jgi:predicted RNA-binding protein YlxR (DUF448 family)
VPRVKKVPQRICVGCRQTKGKKELIRLVRTPEGQVKIDKTGKISGRGAYLCCKIDCFHAALAGKHLERALRMELPQDLVAALEKTILGEKN